VDISLASVDVNAYIEAFLLLFVVFDAVGNAPIFYALTREYTKEEKTQIYIKSLMVAAILLLGFAFLGDVIFAYFHITLDDLRIAGGLLLFMLAIEGLLGREEAQLMKSEDIAIVPMATPLLAGPGSIYTVIYINSVHGPFPTLFAIAFNVCVALLIFKYVEYLLRKLGRNLIAVLSRILAFILAAMAISMIREGIVSVLSKL